MEPTVWRPRVGDGVVERASVPAGPMGRWFPRVPGIALGLLLGVGTGSAATALVVDGQFPRAGSPAVAMAGVATVVVASSVALVALGPVPRRRVGRVELGLRAALTGPMSVAVLHFIWATAGLAVSAGRSALLAGGVTAVLGLVARDRWQRTGGAPVEGAAPLTDLPPCCRLFKRAVDVGLGGVALVVALPVLVVSAVVVSADSRGGWLFVQRRVGVGGRPFSLLKLRTMASGNDDGEYRRYMTAFITGRPVPPGLQGKLAADPRRTGVGVVLRRLSVDELPQLVNVVKGDMSLVGPRPPLPWEVALYDQVMWGRLAGKPGLTGLWQVNGRARLNFSQMVELDLYYLEHWSPWLDLKILARTPKAVVWHRQTG